MLRVQIEIISGASGPRQGTPIPIATLEADNVGGDDFVGDYDLRLWEHSNTITTIRRGKLESFQRSRGAVALVEEALRQLRTRR